MGGGTGYVKRATAYHIPPGVIEYVTGLHKTDQDILRKQEEVRSMLLRVEQDEPVFTEEHEEDIITEIASRLTPPQTQDQSACAL